MIVPDIELTEKNIIKELGHFIDGSPQGNSFCPPKTYKTNKQTTWNTSHLQRNAWSSGKLEYDKLFTVFYNITVMNAEVFANAFEKCRLWTKIQDLVGEGKTESFWICSSYPFRQKARLHSAERKPKV